MQVVRKVWLPIFFTMRAAATRRRIMAQASAWGREVGMSSSVQRLIARHRLALGLAERLIPSMLDASVGRCGVPCRAVRCESSIDKKGHPFRDAHNLQLLPAS